MKSLKWLVALVFFAASFSVHAQRSERNPEEMAKQRTEQMTKEFNLTEEQQAEVHKINMASAEEIKVIRQEKLTADERKERMAELRKNNREKISEVLTEEQRSKAKQKGLMKKESSKRKTDH